MDARNNIATDLFYKVRSRFTGLKLGSETGQITINPEEARFFDFDYMEGEKPIGHVSISLAEPNSMKVYFSHGITEAMDSLQKDNWYGFLKELRMFAKRRLLNFDTRDIAKDNLDKRDYEFLSQYSQPKSANDDMVTSTPVGESIMAESSLYGSRTMSYQKLMDTRLIIKHSHALNDDQAPGARSRNIAALFVENQDGERFKYPFIHLAGARAMQRHVANGGKPYDAIGESIIKMSEEIAQLKSFGNYVVRNDLMNFETNNIVDRSTEALNKLREQIKNLSKQSHYEAYRESFQAQQPLEVPQDVVEDFKEKFTVRNFKEDIATVFPVLYRLMKENELGYNDIVEMTSDEEETTEDSDVTEVNDPFNQFESWVMNLGEESAVTSQDPEEQSAALQQLQELVSEAFPAGTDGMNAIQSLKGLIEDTELYKRIKSAAMQDPGADVRGMVADWLQLNAPEALEQLDFGDMQDTTGSVEVGQQPMPTESIEEADQPPMDPKQRRKWMSWWKDGPKYPDHPAQKMKYPSYKAVPKPGAKHDWEKDYVYDDPEYKKQYDAAQDEFRNSPEYKDYQEKQKAHSKEMEKAKRAHYSKHGYFDIEMTIMNPFFNAQSTDPEDEDTPEEIDVGIDYDIEGDYMPATWGYHGGDPEEYPEIIVNKVVDLDTGEDITDSVDMDYIEQKIADGEGDRLTSTARDYARRNREPDESINMEGPDKKDIPAAQRKASGNPDWKVTQKDLDKEKDSKISHRDTLAKNRGMNVQEVAEFVHSFYDRNTGTFPKGPEGVATMVGKKFGEEAEQVARKFVERMAPQQTTEHNPELQELMRIKELSGIR